MSEGSGSPGAITASAAVDVNAYLNELLAEREKPSCTGHAARLLEQEIGRLQNGGTKSSFIDIHKGRPIRLQVRVVVPVKDHPNFNFVGKLLGPKGNSLKRLQEETQTKMAILGRGSFRDKTKEEELRQLSDPKYSHLHEDLHVEVTTFAPPAEAYSRMSHAISELKPFLVPDYYDDIRQNQLRELALLNRDSRKAGDILGGSQSPTLGVSSTSPSLQATTSPVMAPTTTTAFPSVTAFPMGIPTTPGSLVPMRPGLVPVGLLPRLPVLQPNQAAAAAVAVAQQQQLQRLAAATRYSQAAMQRQITEVTTTQADGQNPPNPSDQFLYGDEYPDPTAVQVASQQTNGVQKDDAATQNSQTFTEEFVEWAHSPLNQCKIKARTRTIFTPYLVPRFGV
ncbi:KH domain-containing, RNA-binding, signal transduction-associated protein 3 [Galendromus occidentalis]|uniref:KH domain-containing, RNA-binding, signal transduction-associated protein 3 n=1 Tax=Galendromus occidentalis TaxID=34638 RepID=A0AAJ6QW86_9ACAR|nr:KH domain-containing, RNA-binding, signal transduction-associated protein 3 [Galendromus occidentalis]